VRQKAGRQKEDWRKLHVAARNGSGNIQLALKPRAAKRALPKMPCVITAEARSTGSKSKDCGSY